jgi:hypothetical protein
MLRTLIPSTTLLCGGINSMGSDWAAAKAAQSKPSEESFTL